MYEGLLFFYSDDGVNGSELWQTDGTENGTVFVYDIYAGSGSSYPYYFTVFNYKLFFGIDSGDTSVLYSICATKMLYIGKFYYYLVKIIF